MARKSQGRLGAVLVVGLGRFGSAVALTLADQGREVLAVEKDPLLANQWSHRFTVIEADATSKDALEQLGARDFNVAVVGIGSSLEASVLTAANLVEMGIPEIWAKATSRDHGRILEKIGAHRRVFPEYDAGRRVAHMVAGRMIDYIEMEDNFTIVKMRPPLELRGFTIGESKVRERYGVNILGVKSPHEPFEYATSETLIGEDDLIIVSGNVELLDEFAARQ
ncbi:potassium channel family protein [Flaviflexus massiliensis]|uniref:potassium channel family protein n=1 Tax=Flaviflexus massiliensis TaxID=1522309 RepID=UPI0006D55804|nr:TrkA family potassium uptake protein [Flaviflexus massiliensis]